MGISLANNQNAWPIRPLSVKRRLKTVLKALGRGEASLSVLLTDDQGLRELNRQFLGQDKATNVLAFPSGLPFPREKASYLGDVAVSLETVAREAEAAAKTMGEVFYFYLIHGTLHLLGYDHSKGPADEEAQTREEQRLLALIPHDL